jgi:hypothetical protein
MASASVTIINAAMSRLKKEMDLTDMVETSPEQDNGIISMEMGLINPAISSQSEGRKNQTVRMDGN